MNMNRIGFIAVISAIVVGFSSCGVLKKSGSNISNGDSAIEESSTVSWGKLCHTLLMIWPVNGRFFQ